MYKIFVDSAQTLEIQAGTIVQGKSGTGANASALIIARDAQIFAEGTATEPIIFTAEDDDTESGLLSLAIEQPMQTVGGSVPRQKRSNTCQ